MLENWGVLFLLGLNLVWLGGLSFLFYKTYQTYAFLTKNIDKKDFAEVLKRLKKDVLLVSKDQTQLKEKLEVLDTDLKRYLQKIGFVRYNPFGNTGGDHSFCLCLLDGEDNGILLTSLHTRQQTRIYTKQIVSGMSADNTELSSEENLCLKKAREWSSK